MSNAIHFEDIKPELSNEILSAINDMGFTQMTPVQASTIPLFLSHKDVLVDALTGSGKTLAFGIPIFEIIRRSEAKFGKYDVGALVIAPTRELAIQIYDVFQKLYKNLQNLTIVLSTGGTSFDEAVQNIENNGVNILIGTPGRILDIFNRSGLINFKKLEVLVLDEADTLLDMGFKETINQIFQLLPKQRRTGLFSATQTKEVKELARAGMRNPVSVTVKVQNNVKLQNQQTTPSTLDNYFSYANYDERQQNLLNFIINHLSSKTIIFCATCACVDYYSTVYYELAKSNKLIPKNTIILGFHGKMANKKRSAIYQKFVKIEQGILFCTDVAARGIDIPDVDWIIQLVAPKDPSFFVHRVGRTARAGKSGGALIYLTNEESPYIELLRGRGVPLKEYSLDSLALKSDHNILDEFKHIASKNRDVLEYGSKAFISFLRAYKENLCQFIFRMETLNIGAVARSYGLLRLPKIPETNGINLNNIDFVRTDINTSSIPYKHKEKEKARLKRLNILKQSNSVKSNLGENNISEDINSSNDNASLKGSVNNTVYTQTTYRGKHTDEKRKRKKKLSFTKKIIEEWNDLADEEQIYKKFKKGKISKSEYDEYLLNNKTSSIKDNYDSDYTSD